MKKTLTTITLAAILGLGSTFANAGIIVAGNPGTEPSKCNVDTTGIIVAGRALANVFFGIIVAGNPQAEQCTIETDGIIVAG